MFSGQWQGQGQVDCPGYVCPILQMMRRGEERREEPDFSAQALSVPTTAQSVVSQHSETTCSAQN